MSILIRSKRQAKHKKLTETEDLIYQYHSTKRINLCFLVQIRLLEQYRIYANKHKPALETSELFLHEVFN